MGNFFTFGKFKVYSNVGNRCIKCLTNNVHCFVNFTATRKQAFIKTWTTVCLSAPEKWSKFGKKKMSNIRRDSVKFCFLDHYLSSNTTKMVYPELEKSFKHPQTFCGQKALFCLIFADFWPEKAILDDFVPNLLQLREICHKPLFASYRFSRALGLPTATGGKRPKCQRPKMATIWSWNGEKDQNLFLAKIQNDFDVFAPNGSQIGDNRNEEGFSQVKSKSILNLMGWGSCRNVGFVVDLLGSRLEGHIFFIFT